MVVRLPLVGVASLIAMGTPCSAPSGSPAITASSSAFAFALSSASSGKLKQKQLSTGLTSSIRASAFSTSSTGEMSLARTRAASSVAGV